MEFFGKVYNLDRTENFEEFLKNTEIPADVAEAYMKCKASQKLEKDGDDYVVTNFYEGLPAEIVRFKSGVAFEENVSAGVVPTSTITVEGNKTTQVQKYSDGNTITYVKEYFPDQLVVTITASFWSGTAKRIYLAQ